MAKPQTKPTLVPAPASDLTPAEGVFFGVFQVDGQWVPASIEFPSKRTVFFHDPMPYQAVAYTVLINAIQEHYRKLSGK